MPDSHIAVLYIDDSYEMAYIFTYLNLTFKLFQ